MDELKVKRVFRNGMTPNQFSWAIFLVILLFAGVIRFIGIDDNSLLQDESTMLEFTKGLLKNGYPTLNRAGSDRPMATYELVPYFIAPMVLLFGWTETAVRLPAMIFSLGTITLIFVSGKSWFSNRVALWAAFLYAISPWAIYWSQNCFYPSQVQFFAMLSTFLVFRFLKEEQVPTRHYYYMAISLCLTYLSWEASGLVFMVYAALLIWLRWGRWNYLWNPHTWLALVLVATIVMGQLVRRSLLRIPYLGIGSSRASISSPQIAMNQPTFDPIYYVDAIFGSEQLVILSIFFLLGMFFLRSNWNLRFVYGFVFLLIGIYTLLLPVQAIRYVYVVLPVFIIAVSAATFYLIDWAFENRGLDRYFTTRVAKPVLLAIFISIQFLTVSRSGLNLSELRQGYSNIGPWELRPDIQGVDFRYAIHALEREYQPGDIVIARGPFLLHAYMGIKGDYAIQEITASLVVYEPDQELPYYTDKWLGNPVLRNVTELKDVLLKNNRVWFLAIPFGPAKSSLGDELYNFIKEWMTLMDEGHNVRLYLWDRKFSKMSAEIKSSEND